MKLAPVENTNEFKKKFLEKFNETRKENVSLNTLLYEVSLDNNLFIVGGYLRSIANNEPPRDLDLIINLPQKKFSKIIENNFKDYKKNRLGGYKIFLEKITIDTWSIEENWAFKKKLIKNIEVNFVDKISEGTFFNFDSLALDLHTFQYNFKHYNDCAKSKILDIIKKTSTYKKLNPTKEANLLRAFYLKVKYGLFFSEQLKTYIAENLNYTQQTFGNSLAKLLETLDKYDKYHEFLSREVLENQITLIFENAREQDNTFGNAQQRKLFD